MEPVFSPHTQLQVVTPPIPANDPSIKTCKMLSCEAEKFPASASEDAGTVAEHSAYSFGSVTRLGSALTRHHTRTAQLPGTPRLTCS